MDYHQPVLLTQTLDLLQIQPDHWYLDATLGNGGHSLEILRRGGSVFGLDQDPGNLELSRLRLESAGYSTNFIPIHGNFSDLKKILSDLPHQPAGLLFDLGLSANQLKGDNRGFSFHDTTSLDMRLDPDSQTLTAVEIINTYDYSQLFEIFSKYAQEQYAKPIILSLIRHRQKHPIQTGEALAKIITDFYQSRHLRSFVHPATKIMMALRIAVNDEFNHLKTALAATLDCPPSTRVALISFHSGDDRLIKQFIITHSNQVTNLTSKPIKPDFAEIKSNPLARSSLLRGYQII